MHVCATRLNHPLHELRLILSSHQYQYSTRYRGLDHAIHVFHFFFFSSRRRHTRCSRDWSSDVCSSDLPGGGGGGASSTGAGQTGGAGANGKVAITYTPPLAQFHTLVAHAPSYKAPPRSEERRGGKEGRSRGAAYPLKKKKKRIPRV